MDNTFKQRFENPPQKLAIRPIVHSWGSDPKSLLQAYRDYGFGGVVTNVPFTDGFTSNPENLAFLKNILSMLEKEDVDYWLYDEPGYPSGQAGGLTLEGHPEFCAKGFYMHRRIAYQPTHAHFLLDEESDKIVWAAKYPLYIPRLDDSFVVFEQMTPVPFTATEVSCDLGEKEVLFIFCVKDGYEGTHSTHNVCSFRKNINIMDKAAVRRFLDVAYEPIAAEMPTAYPHAGGVFTDEPSLHVEYGRDYETWPYALAPWVDGLFEAYEKMYGESILPYLPLLFEGGDEGIPVRVKFYDLVGALVAEAYSGQLNAWCVAHGSRFSGHYLLEESILQHVKQYGNYIKVISSAGYPGVDVLNCFPEIYEYTTGKYPQMAMRKNHADGMMTELCPFMQADEFAKHPVDNIIHTVNMLYMSGVRVPHSYFSPNLNSWKGGTLGESHEGYTDQEESRWLNNYVARLGVMLEGLSNNCGTFMYYGIENTQGYVKPLYCSNLFAVDDPTDVNTNALLNAVYENGNDLYMADADDLAEAARTLAETGVPTISGYPVHTVIVPRLTVMHQRAMDALKALQKAGVTVRFADAIPTVNAENGKPFEDTEELIALPLAEMPAFMDTRKTGKMQQHARGGVVLHSSFVRGNVAIEMMSNKSRTDAAVVCDAEGATLWNPMDGTVTPVSVGAEITVPATRAVFVCYPVNA